MPPRRLVIMRHAQAEPYAESDKARKLRASGRAEAEAAGRFFADNGLDIDRALVSSAARTKETWEQLRAAGGFDVEAQFDDALYNSDVDTVLTVLRACPDDVRTLLYLGHNPCAAYLASILDDGGADPDAMRGLLTGFPPAAFAVFEVPGSWSELAPGMARLVLSRA